MPLSPHLASPSDAPAPHVALAWVRGPDGALVAVSAFAHLAPLDRPRVTCPVCREAVVLHLGDVRAHHAAHASTSRCPLRAPESALHFNTKNALAAALRATRIGQGGEAPPPVPPFLVRHRCAQRGGVPGESVSTLGTVPCSAVLDVPLLPAGAWDTVAVEPTLASQRRPDVLLLRGAQPIAALEVRHTHALDNPKVERFHHEGLAWLEVVAAASLYEEFTAWRPDQPLPVLRTSMLVGWACDYHRGRLAAATTRPARVPTPVVARVVDVYPATGPRLRTVVYLCACQRGRRLTDATLLRRDQPTTPLATVPDGERARVLAAAHEAFRTWAAAERARLGRGTRLDSPGGWQPPASLGSEDAWMVAGTILHPPRYQRDATTRAWVRRPEFTRLRWAREGGDAPTE